MGDKVRPLKLENPADGGTELDLYPTEVNPVEDNLVAKGLYIIDDNLYIGISGSDMIFQDYHNVTPVTLTELVGGSNDYNLDGGFANAVFLAAQIIDGGGA